MLPNVIRGRRKSSSSTLTSVTSATVAVIEITPLRSDGAQSQYSALAAVSRESNALTNCGCGAISLEIPPRPMHLSWSLVLGHRGCQHARVWDGVSFIGRSWH